MTWKWAIFLYLIVWWITLFTVLPLWVKQPTQRSLEHYSGAPEKTHMGRKIILNSCVAALVVLAIHLLLKSGIISLRDAIR